MLSDGQVHDSNAALDALSGIDILGSNIIGDKAYGAKKIRNFITEHNVEYTILTKESNPNPWFCGFGLYKKRHLVECFFNKIKAFRKVAIRYDKLASSFLAFVRIASIGLLSKLYIFFVFSDMF